jgi:hypothetical protein
MKILHSLALAATLALAAPAQEERRPPQAASAPDAYVLGASAFGPNRAREATLSIEVKNTGGRTITAIDWEYVSSDVNGPARGQALAELRNDGLKIRPGEKQKLTKQLAYDENLVKGFRVNSVRVMRVEFEDGPAWERPAEQPPEKSE